MWRGERKEARKQEMSPLTNTDLVLAMVEVSVVLFVCFETHLSFEVFRGVLRLFHVLLLHPPPSDLSSMYIEPFLFQLTFFAFLSPYLAVGASA